MYENAGAQLKSLVSKVTGVLMAGSILTGICIVMILVNIDDDLTFIGTFVGTFAAAVGCAISWLVYLVIATFADVAIDVHDLKASVLGVSPEPSKEETIVTKEELQQQYNMWMCPVCGAKNLQHWKRCADCGAKKAEAQVQAAKAEETSNVCSRCGRTQEQGSAFCYYCGNKLQ